MRPVEAALDGWRTRINQHYGNQPIVLLGVMTGAILPMAWLATRLTHAAGDGFCARHALPGGLQGAELEYRVPPRLDLKAGMC